MPVKWKHSSRFKPELVLEKINSARTINPKGGTSYAGFTLHEHLPILQSMLEFPPAAENIDASTLVWTALGKIREILTPTNLLDALNRELSDRLATRETRYLLVTSASIDPKGLPKSLRYSGVSVRHLDGRTSKYVKAHAHVVSQHRVPIEPTPPHYQWLMAEVKAKSPGSAFSKGMQAIDLQRALWCLMGNTSIEISLATPKFHPINVVRLGGVHTLHKPGGESAREGFWFEPNFIPGAPHRFKNPENVARTSRRALRRIQESEFGSRIATALIRFVRALDQADPDSAFVRLWGALESLVTPDTADYEALVRRCAFLLQDNQYHRQVLEHLREYRNQHLHGGLESENARIHCFQLQMYFVQTAWFFISNAKKFASVREVNEFLDQSTDVASLRNQLALTKRAIRFATPR